MQVFTVKGLALRAIWERPNWDPFDVVTDEKCISYVSDCGGNLIHVFDARGCWRRSWVTTRPTHLSMDCEGSIYVAEDGSPDIRVYDATGKLLKTVTRVDEVAELFCSLPNTVVRAATLLGITLALHPPLYEQEGQAWIGPLDSQEIPLRMAPCGATRRDSGRWKRTRGDPYVRSGKEHGRNSFAER